MYMQLACRCKRKYSYDLEDPRSASAIAAHADCDDSSCSLDERPCNKVVLAYPL